MRIGVGIPSFASDSSRIPGSRFKDYVRTVEEYGFAGGWFLEHLVKPPTYATSWMDPLSALSNAGGATSSLELGTSILISPMREPVLVAKRAATIQHLTDGRLTLGLGTGYVEPEYDAVNVPFEERGPRFREGLRLLRRLFEEDEVTFDGEFYSLENFRLEPTMARPPKIIVGGTTVERDGKRFVPRAVKQRLLHADGWICAPRPPERVESIWTALAAFLEDNDRDPDRFDRLGITWTHVVPGVDGEAAKHEQRRAFKQLVGVDRPLEHADENYLMGSVEEQIEQLRAYEAAGLDRMILTHPPTTAEEFDRQLELWADHVLPAFQ